MEPTAMYGPFVTLRSRPIRPAATLRFRSGQAASSWEREEKFPPRALGLVMEWASLHRQELLEDWELARNRAELNKIAPLE